MKNKIVSKHANVTCCVLQLLMGVRDVNILYSLELLSIHSSHLVFLEIITYLVIAYAIKQWKFTSYRLHGEMEKLH